MLSIIILITKYIYLYDRRQLVRDQDDLEDGVGVLLRERAVSFNKLIKGSGLISWRDRT